MTDCTLTGPASINSGAAVNLYGIEIKYASNPYISVPDIPAQDTSQSYNETNRIARLAETDYLGFSSPMITIRGHFDASATTSNVINFNLLKRFSYTSSTLSLSDSYFASTAINVRMLGFTCDRSVKTLKGSTEGPGVDYQIILVETKT